MRTLFLASSLIVVSACNDVPGELPEPPVLKVISPQRSTMQGHAGPITVTGTVTPSLDGSKIKQVFVQSLPPHLQSRQRPDGPDDL